VTEETTPVHDIQGILATIPHRYPMLLVDRIIEETPGERIVGIKNVTMNEEFFQGHFPGNPIMPGVLQMEAMAQTACMLLTGVMGEDEGPKVPFFMGIDNAKFRRPVTPGDQLRMEITITRARRNIFVVHGAGTVDGKAVVEADITAMLADVSAAT